jgi:hypothetical protein
VGAGARRTTKGAVSVNLVYVLIVVLLVVAIVYFLRRV